jgi:GTP pyrophosphokinase
MGPKGRWVEVQVRSERMDEIEKGVQHITNIKWRDRRRWFDVWLNLQEA